MNRKLYIVLVLWLIVLASLLVACKPEPTKVTVQVTRVVEQEVTVEVTRVVEVEVDTGVPVSLSELAKQIRNEEIDIGSEYGMAPDQRFHQIHFTTLRMECARCHVTKAPLEIAPPASGSPGPVDRRVCLGCHATGPAFKLYVSQE